jgi:hypothetical protein
MRRIGRLVFAGLLAVGGGTALAHGGHGSKVTMDELPTAVQTTFQNEAAGGKIEDLRAVKKAGTTIYEGEVVQNGKGTELRVSEDGKILNRSSQHDEATEKKAGGDKTY